MAEITVVRQDKGPSRHFVVRVQEGNSFTEHRVTMDEETYKRLSGMRISEEECIKRAFEFLLQREPKEAILRSFDITKISYYFPEFEKQFLLNF